MLLEFAESGHPNSVQRLHFPGKSQKQRTWKAVDSVLCRSEYGTLSKKTVHKESGTKLQKGCCWKSLRADVQFSVLRLHCPEVNSQAKDMVNCRYTSQPTRKWLRQVFALMFLQTSSVYKEQSQRDVKSFIPSRKRETTRCDGQSSSSLVLSAIKKEVPLDSDDPAYQIFLLRQHEERIEKRSQQDKVCKFCMDAGFLSVVENGQYFMTIDTGDLTQILAVACREYTLPREYEASQPKGWIQGNTKIVPVLEVATSYLHCKHWFEVRTVSLSRDDTHSWVRISHGSNKFVVSLNNNGTEIPEDQLGEYALKLSAEDFVCRAKEKAKLQRREPAGSSPRIVPIERRNWIHIEPGKYSFSDKSGSFLENEGKSSESIPTIDAVVCRSMESMFDSRRRRKKDIPVLYWWYWNN